MLEGSAFGCARGSGGGGRAASVTVGACAVCWRASASWCPGEPGVPEGGAHLVQKEHVRRAAGPPLPGGPGHWGYQSEGRICCRKSMCGGLANGSIEEGMGECGMGDTKKSGSGGALGSEAGRMRSHYLPVSQLGRTQICRYGTVPARSVRRYRLACICLHLAGWWVHCGHGEDT